MITIEDLRNYLDYDADSGVFYWKIKVSRKTKVGGIAGSVNSGYLRIVINKTRYMAHRLAWFYVHGEWPSELLDHIDGDGLNNKLVNLRLATRQQNNYNKTVYSNNKSGVKGVSWNSKRSVWAAAISVNGKDKHIGYFTDIEEAAKAIAVAREQYHGVFHRHE